jgi:hypothetical protein
MNERKRRTPPKSRCRVIGPDGVPPPTDLRRSDTVSGERSIVRSRESTAVVFCGDAEQVCAGFALALAVMEAHENLLVRSPEADPKGD